MKPIAYLRQESRAPNESSVDWMREYKGLSDPDKATLKDWAAEEMAVRGIDIDD